MVEKLHPDEILYLNLCDWLEPQAASINAELKKVGGLIIRDPNNPNVFVQIKEFDIFHSLLGEMAPGSVKLAEKGGHLLIQEATVATYTIDEIQPYWDGFCDLSKKHVRGLKDFEFKSSFPYGKNPKQCVAMVQEAINDFKSINNFELSTINNINKATVEIENKIGQTFKLYIKNGKAEFFPFSPFDHRKGNI